MSTKKNASWIEGVVKRFINESPENNMGDGLNERAWGDPLVGFSSGDDPIYAFYKEDIGPFYVTPVEWFGTTFPGFDVEPGELTVISWILPQTETTKERHRHQVKWPNERWARSRIFGEEVNNKLRRHVVEALEAEGYLAVAPMLSPHFNRETSEKYGYASSWSERHAAYAAGLGTFGLCDGLITPVGKAMRTGSVVVRIDLPPSKRSYKDYYAYCLYYVKTASSDVPWEPSLVLAMTSSLAAGMSALLGVTWKVTMALKGTGAVSARPVSRVSRGYLLS